MRVGQSRCGPVGSPNSPTYAFASPPGFPAGPRGGAATGSQTPARYVTRCRLRPNDPTVLSSASGMWAAGKGQASFR